MGFDLGQALEHTLLLSASSNHFQHVPDSLNQMLGEAALRHIARGATLEGLDRDLLTAMSGGQDNRCGGILGSNRPDELQAVHLRHLQAGDDDVGHELPHGDERFAPVGRVGY